MVIFSPTLFLSQVLFYSGCLSSTHIARCLNNINAYDIFHPFYESFLQENRDDYLNHINKYRKMQDKYIGKNLNLYSKEQLQEINDSYESLTQKILYTLRALVCPEIHEM